MNHNYIFETVSGVRRMRDSISGELYYPHEAVGYTQLAVVLDTNNGIIQVPISEIDNAQSVPALTATDGFGYYNELNNSFFDAAGSAPATPTLQQVTEQGAITDRQVTINNALLANSEYVAVQGFANGSGSGNKGAIYGSVGGASGTGIAASGLFNDNSSDLAGAFGNAGLLTQWRYGVVGNTVKNNNQVNIGLYGRARNTMGSAWAGYFDGSVFITSEDKDAGLKITTTTNSRLNPFLRIEDTFGDAYFQVGNSGAVTVNDGYFSNTLAFRVRGSSINNLFRVNSQDERIDLWTGTNSDRFIEIVNSGTQYSEISWRTDGEANPFVGIYAGEYDNGVGLGANFAIWDNNLASDVLAFYRRYSDSYSYLQANTRLDVTATPQGDRVLKLKGSEVAGLPITLYGRRHGYVWYFDSNNTTGGDMTASDMSFMVWNTNRKNIGIGGYEGSGSEYLVRYAALTENTVANSAFFTVGARKNDQLVSHQTLCRVASRNNFTGTLFEVAISDNGNNPRLIKATNSNVFLPSLPTYADEAAAAAASLPQHALYKTATGEIRIKL